MEFLVVMVQDTILFRKHLSLSVPEYSEVVPEIAAGEVAAPPPVDFLVKVGVVEKSPSEVEEQSRRAFQFGYQPAVKNRAYTLAEIKAQQEAFQAEIKRKEIQIAEEERKAEEGRKRKEEETEAEAKVIAAAAAAADAAAKVKLEEEGNGDGDSEGNAMEIDEDVVKLEDAVKLEEPPTPAPAAVVVPAPPIVTSTPTPTPTPASITTSAWGSKVEKKIEVRLEYDLEAEEKMFSEFLGSGDGSR